MTRASNGRGKAGRVRVQAPARPDLMAPGETLQALRESAYGENCRVAAVVLQLTSADRLSS